jgi:hypothetical protein
VIASKLDSYSRFTAEASKQVIRLCEPVGGASQAQVILRPVNFLELEDLLRGKDWRVEKRKIAFAELLAFGGERK